MTVYTAQMIRPQKMAIHSQPKTIHQPHPSPMCHTACLAFCCAVRTPGSLGGLPNLSDRSPPWDELASLRRSRYRLDRLFCALEADLHELSVHRPHRLDCRVRHL